jgi:hypothetical protein
VVSVTTWTQDYPALAEAASAASTVAYTLTNQHLHGRAGDAFRLVEHMFVAGLARTAPGGKLNLIAITSPNKIRFELHYPANTSIPSGAGHIQTVSSIADAYGERPVPRGGRMIYAELWERAS